MLKEINFRNSIRSESIQENFQYLESRIKRESLSVGGQGIVKGFQIEAQGDTHISVSSGVLIDKNGNEVIFNSGVYPVKPIEPVRQTTARITVGEQGEIELMSRPYSEISRRYYDLATYVSNIDSDEIIIRSANTGAIIRAINVQEKTLTVDALTWAGKQVIVEFLYAKNRLDKILFNKDGVKIVPGLISPSISGVDDEDYEGYFVLGTVETAIANNTTLIVHTEERQDRAIYIDEDNVAYINGREYRGVFFEKPGVPKLGDIFIDTEKLGLWSYNKTEFGFEWELVNKIDYVSKREVKIFKPTEMPADMQTFLFHPEDELHMMYTTGVNEIDVIIDNVPLMSDQFEEIESTDNTINSGIGFKLSNPLDKESYVEVRITRSVVDSPLPKTYQRSATFIKEGYEIQDDTNTEQIFITPAPYYTTEHQLEVYVEGVRLMQGIEFKELDENLSIATDKGLSTKFKIIKPLQSGDRILVKVTKNIYTYDHIGDILEDTIASIENTADEARDLQNSIQSEMGQLRSDMTSTNNYTNARIDDIIQDVLAVRSDVDNLDGFVSVNDKILLSQLHETVVAKMVKTPFEIVVPCDSIVEVAGVKDSDYFLVHMIKSTGSRPLLRGIDYSVVAAGNNINLMMDEDLIDNDTSLLISGMKFGL